LVAVQILELTVPVFVADQALNQIERQLVLLNQFVNQKVLENAAQFILVPGLTGDEHDGRDEGLALITVELLGFLQDCLC